MNIAAILIGVALLVATLPYLAGPFLLKKPSRSKTPAAEKTSVAEQRNVVLLALRDLDFDYRLGKVTGEDYNTSRAQLVAEAASLIDKAKHEEDAIEQMIHARREASSKGEICTHCGKPLRSTDLYCSGCGHPTSKLCPTCGKKVTASDSFCPGCGVSLTLAGNTPAIDASRN